MTGIPQESSKARPIKCRYVIYIPRSVEGLIIDAHDSDYGHNWNIGLYDIVSPASTRKVEKSGTFIFNGKVVQGKVTYGYCLVLHLCIDKPPDSEQPHPYAPAPHFGLWDERLLAHHPQLRPDVEACRLARTHHFRTNCDELQKEVNTGTYLYPTLTHRLSQPMIKFSQNTHSPVITTDDGFDHQDYGVTPVASPERNQL